MTPVREAIGLPVLFLTVVLLGSVRLGEPFSVVPPSLTALVLAMLLVAALVGSGALVPRQLLAGHRSALGNLNGLSVLATAFLASAQAFTLVTPESGVPAFLINTLLVVLLLQALAVRPDRLQLLRGLLVTFGATFLLKFVVLAALVAPADRPLARALQALFEGVTLGAFSQRAAGAAEGYLAFAVLVLYFVGLTLLPRADWRLVSVTTDRPHARTLVEAGLSDREALQ